MHKVIIYSSSTCYSCRMAKDFLQKNKIEYIDRDIASDSAFGSEVVQKSGQMSVPVLDIDGQIVIGFDESKIRDLLEIR